MIETKTFATLHETLSSRKNALCAVRDRLGIPTLDGRPCEHCGAHLFAQESTQIDLLHFVPGTFSSKQRAELLLFLAQAPNKFAGKLL